MTNEDMQKELENLEGKVIEVTAKKRKGGLLLGIRIVTIPKTTLERNPLPSCISSQGNELRVTYTSRTVTCRYSAKSRSRTKQLY